MSQILLLIAVLIWGSGCATLNKAECLNANWRMIGVEDGAQGRTMDYLGRHRNACAKYQVTPNLDEYTAGHEQGVRQYCNPAQGYNLGVQGTAYNGICPSDLEPAFLDAYNHGSDIHQRQVEINGIAAAIQSSRDKIDELEGKLKIKKQSLINSNDAQERALLLKEVEELEEKISRSENKIRDDRREKERLESQLR